MVGLVLLNGEVARHYWNEFADLTAEQFSGSNVRMTGKLKRKEKVTDRGTLKRAKLLWERANAKLDWEVVFLDQCAIH